MSALFLIESALKSVVICGAAFSALALMRRRPAIERARLLKAAFLMLFFMPFTTLFIPESVRARVFIVSEATLTEQRFENTPVEFAPDRPPSEILSVPDEVETSPLASIGGVPIGLLTTAVYLLCAALIILRLIVAIAALKRLAQTARPVTEPAWRAAFLRVIGGQTRLKSVTLLASPSMRAPASWGWLKPVIVIDAATLARASDADAVLEHEMQHVVGRDWIMLVWARVTLAVYWFNPLIWLLERALVQNCEEAADAAALRRLQPRRYAETLLHCARRSSSGAALANAMSGSALKRRITAVLHAPSPSRRVRGAAGFALLAMTFTALASVSLAQRVDARPGAMSEAVGEGPDIAFTDESANGTNESNAVERALIRFRTDRAQADQQTRLMLQEARVDEAYVAELARLGLEGLSLPELILAGMHGLNEDSVHAYARMGYADLTYQQLFEFTVHDVSQEFADELALAGYAGLSPDELVSLRILGVDAAQLQAFADLGFPALTREELVLFNIHGVTPDYVRAIPRQARTSPHALLQRRIAENARPG